MLRLYCKTAASVGVHSATQLRLYHLALSACPQRSALLASVGLLRVVFMRIGTRVLGRIVHTQHAHLHQRQEDCGAQAAHPGDDHHGCTDLSDKLIGPLSFSEESKGEETPHTACTMHWNSIDDIIQSETAQEHRGTLVHEATDESDDDRLPRLDCTTTCGDGDEACEDAIAKAAHIQALRRTHMGTQGEDDKAGNTWSECGVACH